MKKVSLVLWVTGLFILGLVTGSNARDIVWEDIGRGSLNISTILVNSDNPRIIYIGSGNAVLKTEDSGETWRQVLFIKGQNKTVNFLLFNPQDKNSFYAATGNGLFYSSDGGRSWKRIFRGRNYLENECTGLAVLPYGIYLGTKAGLFVSKDRGRSWFKETGILGKSQILSIVGDIKEPDYIYIACVDGVFKTQNAGQTWERIFVASYSKNGNAAEEESEGQQEDSFSRIRYISIDQNNLNYLYLATSRGAYKSQDKGKSWEPVPSYGLLNQDIKFLLVSAESYLYGITKSGVFEYKNERWQELSFGLTAEEVNFLALDNQDNLYAACNNGLFKANIRGVNSKTQDSPLALYYKDEPLISNVQQAAIKYAEVEPEKIMRWREQAAKKAWLPQISVGLDRNVTDLWHWEGGSTTKVDDDILRRGRDSIEWDIGLSWDLSELIYNDDQTSIDVRSRLMEELRPLNVYTWSLL